MIGYCKGGKNGHGQKGHKKECREPPRHKQTLTWDLNPTAAFSAGMLNY